MTWVYPADEAAGTTRLGLSIASFWVGIVFVAGGTAALITHTLLIAGPEHARGIVGFGLLGALLIVARVWTRMPVPAVIASALVMSAAVGTVGHYLIDDEHVPTYPAIAVVIAATALGGILARWTGAAGTLLGYAIAQAALVLSAPTVTIEVAPAVIAVIIAIYYAFLAAVRRRGRDGGSRLDDAARAELAAAQRRAFELRSRALVHDTVLSELVALGLARPGPLSPSSRASIAESLAAVRGPDDAQSYTARPSRALDAVLARERDAGLAVDVTGDPSILDSLPAPTRAALLQAIDQALVNVRKHAGVAEAELSLAASGASVVATIVDAGVGFVEEDIPADRFGFRESIRGAIEAVGGSARILSGRNAGTSIILSAPRKVAER